MCGCQAGAQGRARFAVATPDERVDLVNAGKFRAWREGSILAEAWWSERHATEPDGLSGTSEQWKHASRGGRQRTAKTEAARWCAIGT